MSRSSKDVRLHPASSHKSAFLLRAPWAAHISYLARLHVPILSCNRTANAVIRAFQGSSGHKFSTGMANTPSNSRSKEPNGDNSADWDAASPSAAANASLSTGADDVYVRELAAADADPESRAPYSRRTVGTPNLVYRPRGAATPRVTPLMPPLDYRPTSPTPSTPTSSNYRFGHSKHSSLSSISIPRSRTISPVRGNMTVQTPARELPASVRDEAQRPHQRSRSVAPRQPTEAILPPLRSVTDLFPIPPPSRVPSSDRTMSNISPLQSLEDEASTPVSSTSSLEDANHPDIGSDDDEELLADSERKDRILAFALRTLFGLDQDSLNDRDRLASVQDMDDLVERLKRRVFQHGLSGSSETEQMDADGGSGGHGQIPQSDQQSALRSAANRQNGKRRKPADNDGDRGGDDSSREAGAGDPTVSSSAKRAKTADFKLSCPFRKRNCHRFNVRDHRKCALTYFTSFSDLR
jgi:hypothetical protein